MNQKLARGSRGYRRLVHFNVQEQEQNIKNIKLSNEDFKIYVCQKAGTRSNFQAEVINEWFAQYSDIKKRSYDDLEFFQMKVFISKRSAWKLCRLMFEWYRHLFVGAEDAVIMLTNYHIEFPWAKSRARFPRNNSSYVNQVFKINFNGLRRMPGQGSCCKFLDIKRREARKIQCVPK